MDMDDDACYRAIETRDHRFDGRLFVAVTTTGIYCRPFCPAPTPKRSHARRQARVTFPADSANRDENRLLVPRQPYERIGHSLGMPQARRIALSALAAAVVADPLIFGPRRSLEEAIAQLRSLAGVGEWTAQYIAMRELREPDAFPAADIGLMRAMSDENGVRPSPAALLARAERWRPWRAYAALHLWASEAHASTSVEKELHDQQAA